MTIIKLFSVKSPVTVKEGYQTIKRRVSTSELFLEVTIAGAKVTINKTNVEEFSESPQTTKVAEKTVEKKK
jgi:hypothetical protein